MILGIGIDVIEIKRIKDAILRQAFTRKVFTPKEQAYCESRGMQQAASYAARFAGKEAVMKAFGTGIAGGSWQDIEILPNDKGQPKVQLYGSFLRLAEKKQVSEVYISLTHAQEYAAAQVLLWGDIT
ncbi:MAG: holo-ACP synthase [Pelosinus sp.]|nr:holo-ACP synthase [Pelosinus sp.]